MNLENLLKQVYQQLAVSARIQNSEDFLAVLDGMEKVFVEVEDGKDVAFLDPDTCPLDVIISSIIQADEELKCMEDSIDTKMLRHLVRATQKVAQLAHMHMSDHAAVVWVMTNSMIPGSIIADLPVLLKFAAENGGTVTTAVMKNFFQKYGLVDVDSLSINVAAAQSLLNSQIAVLENLSNTPIRMMAFASRLQGEENYINIMVFLQGAATLVDNISQFLALPSTSTVLDDGTMVFQPHCTLQ